MEELSNGIILIPARYNSHRLPGKALKDIDGKSMILRTYERCMLSGIRTMVVTDDERIIEECKKNQMLFDLVSVDCKSGTDRVARAARRLDVDWVINVQGDEPFVDPDDIKKVAHQLEIGDSCEVVNGMSPITNKDDFYDETIPKVIAWDGLLKYMSRAPIPVPYGPTKELWNRAAKQQVCIYGFRKHHLEKFLKADKVGYEVDEDIEILRFCQMNIPVRMLDLKGSPLHVDTPEDLERAQKIAEEPQYKRKVEVYDWK